VTGIGHLTRATLEHEVEAVLVAEGLQCGQCRVERQATTVGNTPVGGIPVDTSIVTPVPWGTEAPAPGSG
jgi:hypothetical protein